MTTLIAEFCQNHKGDRGALREMIAAAHEAGATHAKIQTAFADDLVKRDRFEEGITDEHGVVQVIKRPYGAEYARLRPMDLTMDDYAWFVDECQRVGIRPLTTIFTRGRVKDMVALGWKEVKVASFDGASLPLIRSLAQHFSHLFISTGTCYDWEVERTAQALGIHSFSFLHCVSIYPTPLAEAHLNRMRWLRRFTPSVGFSDHTLVARDGIKASLAALAMGADVIERHFTILPPEETKDGPVSIGPKELKELAAFAKLPIHARHAEARRMIPEFTAMLGSETRPLSHAEMLNRDYYRGRFASRDAQGAVVWNWDENVSLPGEPGAA
ncbi:general stress protein [Patescibacteria group bacterium]|nr:MAG: general stress protein [Patescibacteria group bacterium]